MTNAEFQEFYKKNKLVCIGIPFIIGFILFNQFVLKPKLQKKPAGQTATQATAGVTADAGPAPEAAPIGPPPPITISMANVPQLSENVEKRFTKVDTFPFQPQRNMFEPFYKQGTEGPVVAAPIAEPIGEVVIQHPDLTYHGFFTIGQDRVAILKMSGRAILTRSGQKVIETPFVLEAIYPDRVEVVDGEDQSRRFEVALFEGQASGAGTGHTGSPK